MRVVLRGEDLSLHHRRIVEQHGRLWYRTLYHCHRVTPLGEAVAQPGDGRGNRRLGHVARLHSAAVQGRHDEVDANEHANSRKSEAGIGRERRPAGPTEIVDIVVFVIA